MADKEAVSLEFGGDASGAIGELRRLSRAADKEGKQLSQGLGRAWGQARKDSVSAARQIEKNLKIAMSGATTAIGAATVATAALTAAVYGTALAFVEMSNDINGTRDQIGTLSAATGLSAETIDTLRLTAILANKELTELVPRDLAKRIFETAQGTGEGLRAFRAYGVQVQTATGALRNADDVFGDIVSVLSELDSPTERAAAAVKLLGEQGRNLFSAISDPSDLERMRDLASEFGVMAGGAAESSGRWWTATGGLRIAMEALRREIVDGLGDQATFVVQEMAVEMVRLSVLVRELSDGFSNFGRVVLALGSAFAPTMTGLADSALTAAQALIGQTDAMQKANEAADEFRDKVFPIIAPGTGGNGIDETTESLDELQRRLGGLFSGTSPEQEVESLIVELRRVPGAADEVGASFAQLSTQIDDAIDGAFGDQLTDQLQSASDQLRNFLSANAESALSDFVALREESIAEQVAAVVSASEAQRDRELADLQAVADAEDAGFAQRIAHLQALESEGKLSHAAAQARIDELQAQRDASTSAAEADERRIRAAQRETAREASAAARRQFAVLKGIRIAQATADAAAAAIALMASPGFALLGPFAPAAAAATAAGALAAQIAVIAKQQPPAFPTGGVVATGGASAGHAMALLEPGEGVASRRAMSQPGFAELLEMANRGSTPIGGSPVGVVVRYDRSAARLRVVPDPMMPGRRRSRGT